VTRVLTSIAAALALLFGVVGCGEDSNDEFKDQYNEALRPLSSLGDEVVSTLTEGGQSDQALGRQLEKLAGRAEETRKNLSELEPPEDAADQYDELLGALKQSVADLRAVGESAREGDPVEAQEATQALVESGQELQQAETAFRNAVEG
jgi:hypothetical protein